MIRLLPALVLLACNYEAPHNPYAAAAPNVITGPVITSAIDPAQTTVVFLTNADNPMPPSGTGSPINFATIPGDDFTADPDGLRSANYTLTNVPEGAWLLTALMDRDANFHPLVPTLAGATCGDLTGGRLSGLGQPVLEPLEVSGGDLFDNVALLMGAPASTQRPAFTMNAPFDRVVAGSATDSPTALFSLSNVPIHARYGENFQLDFNGPWSEGSLDPCETSFLLYVVDDDGDGVPDPHPDLPPEAGVPDVWPRVILQWVGEPVDRDDDGITDGFDRSGAPVPGATYATIAPTIPYNPLDYIAGGTPEFPIGQPFRTAELWSVFPSQAVETDADGQERMITDPAELPAGAWSVTVILHTGQTWAVPNELDVALPFDDALPPPGVTSPRDPSQGTFLTVAPPP